MSLFKKEFAIDLGTKNIVIMCNDKILVDDEAVIAVHYRADGTRHFYECGKRVLSICWKGGVDVRIIRPFKDGRIEDKELFDMMLTAFIEKAKYLSYPKWVRFFIDIPYAFEDAPALWVYLGMFLSLIGWIIYRFC